MAILSIVAFSLEVSSSRKDCPSENFEGDGDSCKQCPANHYNDGTSLNCTACPTGECSPVGSKSATACTTCPPAPGVARLGCLDGGYVHPAKSTWVWSFSNNNARQ